MTEIPGASPVTALRREDAPVIAVTPPALPEPSAAALSTDGDDDTATRTESAQHRAPRRPPSFLRSRSRGIGLALVLAVLACVLAVWS
ncbi:MAG: hypothetical protein M3471_02725, partial [Actinomycetota bacterium]|nr:hypothetical protein [Actinomycetota bacterium]